MRKNKDKRIGFFINIATSGKYSGESGFGMSDSLIRYALLNFVSIFGIMILAAYNVLNFQKGLYDIVAASTGMMLVALTCVFLARTKIPQVVVSFLLMFFFGLLCIWMNYIKQVLGLNFLFIYVYPPLSIMLLGLRYGAALSVSLLVLMVAEMVVSGWSHFDWHIEAVIRIVASYLLVFSVMVVIEFTRKTKDRMIEAQNRRLEELKREADAANRAKSDFLAVMSHEIRTPLNAVIGLSQIELQDRRSDRKSDRQTDNPQNKISDTSKENIRQIHRSGSYLLGIINDVLDISKIESGNFELVPDEYESESLIGDTINLNRVRLASKPVHFILKIDGDFPRKLKGDELRIKQILNNLLSNAAKYTNEGTITLSVSWHPENSENILIRFAVRDTGIGIKPADMGKLFEDYVQLDPGVNRKTEGTGLGLSIAQKLAQMMGGTISAESEYGKGSVFNTEIVQGLVCDTGTLGEETAENLRNFRYVSERREKIFHSPVPPGKVLIVDDRPENLLVARGLLAPYSLKIETASSGREALAKAQAACYDLIFMDHVMPDMDGVEVARIIMNHGVQAPIIALTANAVHGMKEYYLEHGFQDYLSKPINASELDKILVKWLKNEQPEMSNEQNTLTNTQTTNNNISHSSFSMEIESRRLDMLNHHRVSFEIGKEFDTAYFERFTALVRTIGFQSADLQEQIAILIKAGQNGDVPVIRETLPALCEALKKQKKSDCPPEGVSSNADSAIADKALAEILSRLKKAIQDGETETAENLVREAGKMNLSPSGRQTYFKINDFFLAGAQEKALETINFWELS